MAITPRSVEESRALLRKAMAARAENQAARRASTLRRDFEMDPEWVRLATARRLRLPPWGEPVTPKAIRRWLKKLGISVDEYLEYQGVDALGKSRLADFNRRNPDWPLRAWVGLLLEAFPPVAEKEDPELGELIMVQWQPFPRCDRSALGRIEEIDEHSLIVQVSVNNDGQLENVPASSGCVRGCTDQCHTHHGLDGGTQLRIRRQGLVRLERRDPFSWLAWGESVEAVQIPPEGASAA